MNDYENVIERVPIIQFDQINAGLERQSEGRQSIFRRQVGETAMPDHQGSLGGDELRCGHLRFSNIHFLSFRPASIFDDGQECRTSK